MMQWCWTPLSEIQRNSKLETTKRTAIFKLEEQKHWETSRRGGKNIMVQNLSPDWEYPWLVKNQFSRMILHPYLWAYREGQPLILCTGKCICNICFFSQACKTNIWINPTKWGVVFSKWSTWATSISCKDHDNWSTPMHRGWPPDNFPILGIHCEQAPETRKKYPPKITHQPTLTSTKNHQPPKLKISPPCQDAKYYNPWYSTNRLLKVHYPTDHTNNGPWVVELFLAMGKKGEWKTTTQKDTKKQFCLTKPCLI